MIPPDVAPPTPQDLRGDIEHNALIRSLVEISHTLDLDTVLLKGMDGIRRVLGGNLSCFLLIQSTPPWLKVEKPIGMSDQFIEQLGQLRVDPIWANPEALLQNPNGIFTLLDEHTKAVCHTQGIPRSVLLPLSAPNGVVGIVLVGAKAGMTLTPANIDLLLTVAEHLSIPIENARLHARLQDSEAWHRTFIEQSPDGFWEGTVGGHTTYVNDAACQILGFRREELIGQNSSLVNPAAPTEDRAAIKLELMQNGFKRNRLGRVLTKDGRLLPLRYTTRLTHTPSGLAKAQTVFRDETQQQQLLDAVEQRNRELSALNEIASILGRPLELQSALDLVCAQLTSITGMDTASVYGRDVSGQHLNLLAQHGMTPGLLQVAKHLGLDDPVIIQLASVGRPVAINNIQEDTSSSYAGPKAEGYRAGIGMPIFRHGQPSGILFVASRTRAEYDPADVELTLNISRQVGVAMENAELYAEMQQRVFELESLTKLSAACATSLEPKALAQTAIDWTRQLLFTDFAVVRFLESGQFRLLASYSAQPRAPLESLTLESEINEQLRKRQPIVVDNVHTTTFSAKTLEALRATQLEALLAVPLFARDRMIGLVAVGHARPHTWQPREVNLLQTIADQIANSIDNAHLFQRVAAEQRKVQAIFDSGLSGLYATDADGGIVMFNRAAERMTGWSYDQVRNKKWEDVLRDPRASDREPLIYEALRQGKTAFAYEGWHIRTRDGRIIAVAKAVAPLFDETNQVIGAVGAFWDRSRELAAEHDREEFLQTAAHQLRTPLTSLLLSLDVLQRKNIRAKRRAEMSQIARTDGAHLRKLAHQLLDWEKLTENKSTLSLEPVAIVATTRALVQRYIENGQTKHRFMIDAPKSELLVDANLDAVEQILRNLIDNATNYSPAESTITIAIIIDAINRVQVSVRDQGSGIPNDEQQKIFHPFYRSESAGKHRQYGHGLGLAIAQRFARQMDSEIHVESEPGLGAKFYFSLRRHA